jgi:hypothetical protein
LAETISFTTPDGKLKAKETLLSEVSDYYDIYSEILETPNLFNVCTKVET